MRRKTKNGGFQNIHFFKVSFFQSDCQTFHKNLIHTTDDPVILLGLENE